MKAITCGICGEDFPAYKTRESFDEREGRLCRDCFSDSHYKCEKCGTLVHGGYTTERRNGETWCLECAG